MTIEHSYTIEEVANLLKVSKLTIYDLVKKGELPVFRVGRQMRMSAADLDRYVKKQTTTAPTAVLSHSDSEHKASIVISGQDIALDILAQHIEKEFSYKALRSHAGSLNSLISMYQGKCDIVSLHMYDGDTGDYNLPYVKRILSGYSYTVIHLLARQAGLYVQKGNPLHIRSWTDLGQEHVTIINREKGSGARILLDEQLRIHNLSPRFINGYEREENSHLRVAAAVLNGTADAGVGIEKAAQMVGVDFIPLITERYDLVLLKMPETEQLVQTVQKIVSSPLFQAEIGSLGNYDCSQTGRILFETD
ncbi:helix-turn-helix transcriptional regulator [Domibacillus sp. DTU_2020_1001157_1_SI_ALB_TIR_016]|uniref:helix-turn-helix transcriptional regulator n=1 Tax=Domibacillus sp. DTU_2020_1001157_1_SI_ALB_TIR_016 TaxID=3077789 RepID=UPI0028EA69BC|nr:helix-turn-helix transcriptional regulator [Domibacillus sp. DTU_2020_1001157_1_SI_ALB_TIR_016]WNS79457.1 helix-turn-helix transcriptional regulator [Domibacillus sp. DTU_2020_1001157_1_SI_ALB_TIR_016]